MFQQTVFRRPQSSQRKIWANAPTSVFSSLTGPYHFIWCSRKHQITEDHVEIAKPSITWLHLITTQSHTSIISLLLYKDPPSFQVSYHHIPIESSHILKTGITTPLVVQTCTHAFWFAKCCSNIPEFYWLSSEEPNFCYVHTNDILKQFPQP